MAVQGLDEHLFGGGEVTKGLGSKVDGGVRLKVNAIY